MDEQERVDGIIDKIMEYGETQKPRGDEFTKNVSRMTGKPHRDDEDDKEMSYKDWVKSQPKPKTIGIHKKKF